MTFTPNIPETNNSVQNLISLFYHRVVYRTSNNHHFHDQIGYLTRDKTNNLVYDTSCIPRGVCFVAEGQPSSTITMTTKSQGIAQTQYMVRNEIPQNPSRLLWLCLAIRQNTSMRHTFLSMERRLITKTRIRWIK